MYTAKNPTNGNKGFTCCRRTLRRHLLMDNNGKKLIARKAIEVGSFFQAGVGGHAMTIVHVQRAGSSFQ